MVSLGTKRTVAPLSSLSQRQLDADGFILGHEPDEQYLNALLQLGWTEQVEQREIDARIEALLDDQHDLGLPDVGLESEEVRGGWGLELVQRIKQFWPNPPTIKIPTGNVGEEPENFANDLEAALNALISVQSKSKRGPGGLFYDEVKEQQTAFGRGYGLLLPDPRGYRGYPMPQGDISDPKLAREYLSAVDKYGKYRLPPLKLRSLEARRTIPFFDDDGLAELFWVTTERAWEVMARARARGITQNRTLHWVEEKFDDRAALSVVVIHYANRSYCAELVGSPRSFPPHLNNPYWIEDTDMLGDAYPHWLTNRVPVAYFPGMTTPMSDRSKKTVSAIYQLRNIITMLDRLASMKATAVRIWAWPTPVLKASLVNAGMLTEGDDGRPRPIEIQPGMVVTLWGDEELSFLTYQGNGPDQNDMITMLEKQYERIGLPIVESGVGGDVSGYALNQLRAAERGKWSALQRGMEQGWEDLGWLELEYLKQMPGPIWVPTVSEAGWAGNALFADSRTAERSAYLRIKPEQLRNRTFLMEVKVEPDRSLDLVANAQAAVGMQQLGVPKRIIFEDVLGLQNYSQIKLMKMLEDLEETPEYRQEVFGEALRQGRLSVEQESSGQGGGLTPEELTQYSPGMIQAFVQAGLVPPQVAQQVLQQQGANIMPGQVGGAMAGGNAPAPPMPMGGAPAPGGAPGATPMQGGPAGMMAGMLPPAAMAGVPTMGGAPSPAVTALPAAPPVPKLRGRGRAPGQSRTPARRAA